MTSLFFSIHKSSCFHLYSFFCWNFSPFFVHTGFSFILWMCLSKSPILLQNKKIITICLPNTNVNSKQCPTCVGYKGMNICVSALCYLLFTLIFSDSSFPFSQQGKKMKNTKFATISFIVFLNTSFSHT